MKNYPVLYIGILLCSLACSKPDPATPLEISINKIKDSLTLTPISFAATVSIAPDSYKWDFGDGTTSTDASPVHTYKDMGYYNVVCTATHLSVPHVAQYQLKIKGDKRLSGERHFSGTFVNVFTDYAQQKIITTNRVIADTVIPFTWYDPFNLNGMLLNHDTGTEVQYQTPGGFSRTVLYLRYYPANDSIYFHISASDPAGSSSTYEFVNKK